MLPCLPTKFHRPPLSPHAVLRPRLLARLNQGLASQRKLTLVIAPAGFGKTTLVNQWLQPHPHATTAGPLSYTQPVTHASRVAWLTLDVADNEFARFFQYIVTAVQMVFPTSGAESLRLLQAPQLPPIPHLAATLLHEWATLPAHWLLVLEDYDAIRDTAIHQLVTQLLDHLPKQVHLVLLSRTEPPLALARLRVQHQLTELRASDLSFSLAETKAFLAETLGYTPTLETVAALHRQTEGWVAGLQLAMWTWAGSDLPALLPPQPQTVDPPLAATFTANNSHVMAYLVEEVLARQPQAVQMFLLRTALLERFCAPLAEVLLAQEKGVETTDPLYAPAVSAQAILAYLVQTQIFIVSLDAQGEWYRYHQLFRDLLQHHLHVHTSAAVVADLHRRASVWLASQGWQEEAIRHALAGGDEDAAVHIIAQERYALLNREDFGTLNRWLALFPPAVVQHHATLLMTKALVLSFQFKLATLPPLLQAIATRLSEPTLDAPTAQILQGEMDGLWSQHWYWQQEGQRSLAAAQQALARLPADYLYGRSGTLLYFGLAMQMTGQTTVAVQTLRTALEGQQDSPSTFVTRILFALAFIHYLAGELTLVQQIAAACLQVAQQANLAITLGWAHYLLGCVHYEWNELALAAQHFTAIVDLRYRIHGLTAHHGWLALAWTQQAQGRPDHAQKQVAALLNFHYEMNHQFFLPLVHSFQARLALQQGKLATAARWAGSVNLISPRGPIFEFELPLLTHAKILLAQGAASTLADALANLMQLRQVAEFTHNTTRLVEILAVQALVEAAQGQTEQALATLQHTVLLAKSGRCIRTFVDLGPTMAGLLYHLAKRNIEAEYVGEVLAAFPPTKATTASTQQTYRATPINLIEPLTERESEVLLHLQQGLPNKAIAQALKISALTVKRHLTNLYQKLGVKGRKQAVARAKALGILPIPHA